MGQERSRSFQTTSSRMNCEYLHICTLLKDVVKRMEAIEKKMSDLETKIENTSVMVQLGDESEEDEESSVSSSANSAPF